MARDRAVTLAIVACMVSAVSTIPALLISGSMMPPVTNNYYETVYNTTNVTTTNTNTTNVYNGTYIAGTPHFANITAWIPYSTSSIYALKFFSIPLVNRTIVTGVVSFSFNRRSGGSGSSSYYIVSRLNNQTVIGNPAGSYPSLEGYTLNSGYYYTTWTNYYNTYVYPNASTYTLDICGHSADPNFAGLNISVCIWWETW